MTTLNFTRHLQVSLGLGVALMLSACSGDGRPLEEAVETNQLNLASINIVQPTGLLFPLFVNPGEQINFMLSATRSGESRAEIPLSAADRRWSVESVKLVDDEVIATTGRATIDSNGTFIGTADGVVTVFVQIGGLTGNFEVTVAQAELTDIAISPVEGESMEGELTMAGNMLERCLPEMYMATGTYTDTSERTSTRGLQDIVDWSTANEAMGIASAQSDGTASVTAFDAGTLDLIATVGNVSSTASIGVVDNLLSIDILPDVPGVMEGSTLQLIANGTFARDGQESSSNITDYVTWTFPDDSGFATVSNDESKKGLVTGVAVGNLDVKATCGDLPATKTVVVIENDGSGSNNLAFEEGPVRTIYLSQGPVQLNVSNGAIYDDDAAITFDDETSWSVSEGGQFVAFSSDPNRKGIIIPKAVGIATIRVTIDGGDDGVDAEATQRIVVEP